MIKTLPEILDNQEIQMLIQYFVEEDRGLDISDVIDKLSKKMRYEIRKHSHSVTSRQAQFSKTDFENIVWNYYIRKQINEGRTTGDVALEVKKPLEFLNSFF